MQSLNLLLAEVLCIIIIRERKHVLGTLGPVHSLASLRTAEFTCTDVRDVLRFAERRRALQHRRNIDHRG